CPGRGLPVRSGRAGAAPVPVPGQEKPPAQPFEEPDLKGRVMHYRGLRLDSPVEEFHAAVDALEADTISEAPRQRRQARAEQRRAELEVRRARQAGPYAFWCAARATGLIGSSWSS